MAWTMLIVAFSPLPRPPSHAITSRPAEVRCTASAQDGVKHRRGRTECEEDKPLAIHEQHAEPVLRSERDFLLRPAPSFHGDNLAPLANGP